MDSVTFKAFAQHAAGATDVPNDYVAMKVAAAKMFPKVANYANDLARRAAQAGKLRPLPSQAVKAVTKLAMGLDSHAMLAQSMYHNNGANAVGALARANPAHRSGLLGAVKNVAPAVGGIRTAGTNPLRAVASGVLHSKLAGVGQLAGRVGQAVGQTGPWGHAAELAGLGILARPSIQRLRGKPVSHKSEAGHELLGLGTLAAPSAYHLLTGH